MKLPFRFTLACVAVLCGMLNSTSEMAIAQSNEEDLEKLLALKVIQYDQNNAQGVMKRVDRNRDGMLDNQEQMGLGSEWTEPDKSKFDLDKNNKLTLTEIAIWFAHRRSLVEVTEDDLNAARKMVSRHDRNRDSRLNEKEIQEGKWPTNPSEYDTDKDGKISPFEIAIRFSANRRQRRESGVLSVDHSEAMRLLSAYDKNKDKLLDATESAAAPIPREWKSVDKDQDGFLNLTELGQLLAAKRQQRGVTASEISRARFLMARFDHDHNNVIDAAERDPINWPKELDEADADKSGRITAKEIENYFANARKQAATAPGVTEKDQATAARVIIRYDTNRNSKVDVDEIENPPVGVAEITVLSFVDYDVDFDGSLSRAEVASYIAKRRLEANEREQAETEKAKAEKAKEATKDDQTK